MFKAMNYRRGFQGINALISVPRDHKLLRLLISVAVGLLSGFAAWWGILRVLAAPFERQYGPNVFAEDATVGVTMFAYMIETSPVALIVAAVVSIIVFRVYVRRQKVTQIQRTTAPISHQTLN
jgi:NhaP-type Na+/H+ or K+/H+ antiporter